MRWLQSLGPESRSLNEIDSQFLQMMQDGRHVFDAAANALLGGTDPEVIRKDLFATDRRINRTEQAIRREIVIHGALFGQSTFPALLVMMSIVKDAERIGDYAKNLYDLAAARPNLGSDERRASMIVLKDRVSKLIVRAHGLYQSQDDAAGATFLGEVKGIEDDCDAVVEEGLACTNENAAARVLAHRYFKRVVSHTGNIITSLVVPLDKLDYFDEPRDK
ncbi:MAG: phosphate transport system protein [Candidatus Paceibacteria bacterium]|jgi:phosphate transport system protein